MINLEFYSSSKPKQRSKGKSLLIFPDDFVVIDIETTGLTPDYDEIIELSALKVSGNNVIDSFSSLVKPTHKIDDFIVSYTGITNEMLQDAPSIKTALPAFLDFIGDSLIVGHNANFDINFIYDYTELILKKTFSNDFVDTMRLSRWLLKELPSHKLQAVIDFYSIGTTVQHRALADCQSTLECLQYLCSTAISEYQTLEGFYAYVKERKRKKKTSAKGIAPESEEAFDIDNLFYQKRCVFTGTLSRMTRKEAMQLVVNIGGICEDTITKKTNFLIIGNQDYAKVKDGKSSKHKKAEQYKLKGQDIEIISEDVFYDNILDEVED